MYNMLKKLARFSKLPEEKKPVDVSLEILINLIHRFNDFENNTEKRLCKLESQQSSIAPGNVQENGDNADAVLKLIVSHKLITEKLDQIIDVVSTIEIDNSVSPNPCISPAGKITTPLAISGGYGVSGPLMSVVLPMNPKPKSWHANVISAAQGGAKKTSKLDKKLNLNIKVIGLRTREQNALIFNGCNTLRDIVVKSEKELLAMKFFGIKGLNQVKSYLAAAGLSLNMKL